jgi:drug/metabolite transporter (DMT)-like permease
MNERNKNLIFIHLSVFLFGFSALFARLVNQAPIIITFGRVFFSSIFLFIFIMYNKLDLKLNSKKDYFLIIVSGIILTIHWYCFIKSIQLSTVAIGTITFSSFPIFTSFLEPLVFREKIKLHAVVCSAVMLIGILIIAPLAAPLNNNHESNQRIIAIAVGLVSSLTYAILSLLNRNLSKKYKPGIIVFYEQATVAIVLLPFFFLFKTTVRIKDLFFLAALGIVFTAIAHGLFVKGLRYVEASTAGVISGLEAVYSIALAAILLHEIPGLNEITGGLIVIFAAGYMTLRRIPKAQ